MDKPNRAEFTPTQLTLEVLEDECMKVVNEWKRKIIKKDTNREARQIYVMCLHEFVKSLESIFERLGSEVPEVMREATEI